MLGAESGSSAGACATGDFASNRKYAAEQFIPQNHINKLPGEIIVTESNPSERQK